MTEKTGLNLNKKKICIYDATLREGAQSAGASFGLEDKLKLAKLLDGLGVKYIEGGNPGSNKTDARFFKRMSNYELKNATLVAFGATARVGVAPQDDANIQALLDANTKALAIFGKSWTLHVSSVLHCTLEENLALIRTSTEYLKSKGKEVIYDAEHFFDGFKADQDYALETLAAAKSGGADWLCLCDTNGGALPGEIKYAFKCVKKFLEERFGDSSALGIHCHDDSGLAVANSIEAVNHGASMAQCTLNGWGERCGNADLFTLTSNLQLKMNCDCVSSEAMSQFFTASMIASEIANRSPVARAPFVGRLAFAHKAGMHIDAVIKSPETFEHIPPQLVGNKRTLLLSEMSGRSAILEKVSGYAPHVEKDSPEMQLIIDELKRKEAKGYHYEVAEASFHLMVRRLLSMHKPFFDVKEYKVVAVNPAQPPHTATVMVRVNVGEAEEITAADGDGPVNALDLAVRKALERFYPSLKRMSLSDFKVRVLDSRKTASSVRVLIESTDGENVWSTVGAHVDILQASFLALCDSLEYKLLLDCEKFERDGRETRTPNAIGKDLFKDM